MHISLTPELEKFVQDKVQSGFYGNQSEVIREALRLMDSHEAIIYETKLRHLRALIEEGRKSGISEKTPEEILKIARKRAKEKYG